MPDKKLTPVVIYTDGACSGNPGPGGWGAILMAGGKSKELSGGEAHTTNNRMELMAVIKALEALNRPCHADIYSDSAYVVNAFNQNWIANWQRNNWRNSAKAEVANVDLWKTLLNLTSVHEVVFHKVKGHADNEYNNRCDQLAVMESSKFQN
ncbi:ribonuclease HI [Oscillospiraceae bacterium]|nr:ribonuclease HI [Oscillospiraceae bacterium]